MPIGNFFKNNSIARKELSKPKIAKKKSVSDITWPEKPGQQVKDYQVITTDVELIAYLKRCEETGLCGFDYETTISDKYREMWQSRHDEFRGEILALQDDLIRAEEFEDKKTIKRVNSELNAAQAKYDKAMANDFLKAPLDPWKSEICTLSLSAAPHEARVIFIKHPGEKVYNAKTVICNVARAMGKTKDQVKEFTRSLERGRRKEVFDILNERLFKNRKITKIAVNMSFETKQTAAIGMYIMAPVADPLIMWVRCLQVVAPERIADPKRPAEGKGLKPMTKEVFGVEMTPFEELLKERHVQFFSEISSDDPKAVVYSAEDSDYAVQHYLYWREIAKQIPKYDEWLHNIEMPFTRVIGLMEYWGMSWDMELANKKRLEAETMRDEAIDGIKKLGERFGVDLQPGKTGKTGSVKSFLFDTLKAPAARLSEKTSEPSLDEEALIDMTFMVENKLHDLKEEAWLVPSHEKHLVIEGRSEYLYREYILELLELVQKVQTYTTLLSSHIDGRSKYLNPISGRIHAGYSQWVETGRLNSFHPNGQNVPRTDNDVFGIRNFYRAPAGKILFFIDFSGFELRLMAWASGDETMTETFKNGGDLHRKTASTMTGKLEAEITKVERTHAKAGNFGICYGGTEHALQKTIKTDYKVRKTLDECAKIVNAVKNTYKRIPEFQEKIALKAREQGYVQTIYGYIRMLPNINSYDRRAKSGDERRAANTPIQGSAADIMKRCQNEVYEMIGKGGILQHQKTDMIGQIHDEILMELDDDPNVVIPAAKLIKEIMERPPLTDFPLPIEAEASVGYRWGDKMSIEKWLEMRDQKNAR